MLTLSGTIETNKALVIDDIRVTPKCPNVQMAKIPWNDLPFSLAFDVLSSNIDAGSDVPNFPRATTVMRYKAFSSKFVKSMLVSLVVNS